MNNLDIFNINKYVGIIAFGLGKIGVNIFILIMGYFSIERNLSVKKILKLWLQVFFYSFGIAVIFKLLLNTNISIKEWINFIFPISYNKYWFITIYIFLYLLTPWLNHYFNKINKEEYKKILIMLFGVLIVFYSIFYKSTAYSMNELMPYSNLLVFMFLYLLGGYIKKYDITKLKAMKQGKLALSLIIIFIIFYLFLITCEIIDYKYNKLGGVLYWYTRQTSIFVFILSVLIFYYFKNLKIKNSKLINTLAKGSLGVYLIQSHTFIGGATLYKKWINTMFFIDSNFLIIHLFFSIVIIYLVGSMIDLVRQNVFEKNIFKIKKFDEIFEKIERKIFIK